MPTETLIAVKVPAEVAAHIDRVSSDRQRFVMLAIMDALARQATASETEVDKDNDRAKLDRESREWLEEDMGEYLASLPDDDWSDLFKSNPGIPIK